MILLAVGAARRSTALIAESPAAVPSAPYRRATDHAVRESRLVLKSADLN